MNEGLEIYLNLDEKETVENEALIRKIDVLLLDYGVKYTGFRNVYVPIDPKNRDQAVFAAYHALWNTDWLKDRLVCVPVMNRTGACSLEQIQTEHMEPPSTGKLEYYERFYRGSHKLAHQIVVDECKRLRDGYISYILAQKYGLHPDIFEAFAEQPLQKVVRGWHVFWNGTAWKKRSNKIYNWNYTLRSPVVPGDILKVRTQKGQAFIRVHRIDYITGKGFCKEYKNVMKHMHVCMSKNPAAAE